LLCKTPKQENVMPLPIGTYTINANGIIDTLVIGFTATGSFNGTVFGQPIQGIFDETEQEFSFIQVTSPDLSTFRIYYGTFFSFSPTSSTLIQTLAGEFLSYPSTGGPATPFTWSAQLSQKLKEKEGKDIKDKEQSKDVKDIKDRKENLKEKDGKDKDVHKELEIPFSQAGQSFDQGAIIEQLLTRLSALEQQIAVGQSFISPSERPHVGTKASNEDSKST
jgi:hypothetical protein